MYLGNKLVAFGALLYGQTLNSDGTRNLKMRCTVWNYNPSGAPNEDIVQNHLT